jgi:hypothetical protein
VAHASVSLPTHWHSGCGFHSGLMVLTFANALVPGCVFLHVSCGRVNHRLVSKSRPGICWRSQRTRNPYVEPRQESSSQAAPRGPHLVGVQEYRMSKTMLRVLKVWTVQHMLSSAERPERGRYPQGRGEAEDRRVPQDGDYTACSPVISLSVTTPPP